MVVERQTVYAAILPGITGKRYIAVYELVAGRGVLADDVEKFEDQFRDIPFVLPKWSDGRIDLKDSNFRTYRMSRVESYTKIMKRMNSFCRGGKLLVRGEEARIELTNLLPHIVESIFHRFEPSQ